ncbi:MAG TPA: hypothetical protein VEY67_12095 [Candidatus Dormibacteraeota bacterium]|nr:hypothetical protein [Candidatus Dormibacteraeota bacterium]
MRGDPRRLVAVLLAIVLLVGVGAGILASVRDRLAPATVTVRGLIGSEKQPFFSDARVIAALKRGGFVAEVSTAGSRQIALADLSKQDFAFPAGGPAAERIRRDHPGSVVVVPFFTPMTIATWKPIVAILEQNGVIAQRTGYLAFDVGKYMDLVARDARWKDLAGATAYSVNKSVLVTSTDVRTSNSAAMYLSLASYVANGDNIVTNDASLDRIAGVVAPLFIRQGFVENSSEVPFEDYLVQGMGKSPLVMIYEAQFLARAAANDGSVTAEMQLVYPEPTILSKHSYVGLTDAGRRLGDFLSTDAEIRSLATQYGFRTSDAAAFRTFVQQHQLTVPDQLLDVIDPPTYETLEALISRIQAQYTGPSPSPGVGAGALATTSASPGGAP